MTVEKNRSRIVRRLRWGGSRLINRIKGLKARLFEPDAIDESITAISTAVSHADLSDKVIVITGSTRGVGLAVAKLFAQSKAKVVVNGRTIADVESSVKSIRNAGGTAIGVPGDISTQEAAKQIMDEAVRAFGRVNVLINNAAVLGPYPKQAWEIEPEDWQEVISINLSGAFLCSRLFAGWIHRNDTKGRIINVSSGVAQTAVKKLMPYFLSKVGLEAMTKSMAFDAGWGCLTVTGIELGSVQTRLTKGYYSWDEFQVLPPPETVFPIFLYAATAPHTSLHGRILADWRYSEDSDAEAILQGPLATIKRATFPPLKVGDKVVNRFSPEAVVLDRAENSNGMPEKVRSLLTTTAHEVDFSRYPDEHYPQLRQALSSRLKIPKDCFTFGSGAADLVERTLRTFTHPGDEVISNDPSWFMFDRFCYVAGIVNRKVPFKQLNGGFDHHLDEVVKSITPKTRLIYLVSPSNPVGVGISTKNFLQFLDQIPPHLPLVVDEAYIEFSPRPDILRSNELILKTDRRVIGLRTFSKFYGLAGLRIGYGFAATHTLRLFNRLEPTFVLSSLAERAALVALEDKEHQARTLDNLRRERTRIQDRLTKAGLKYIPSEIHFILVECPAQPEKVYDHFAKEGIFVSKGLVFDRYIIFPIVQPSQNDKNLDILCSI